MRVGLEVGEQVLHELLRLFFVADNRVHLGFDVGAYHMYARRARAKPHAEFTAASDDFRFLQRELIGAGGNDAVAGTAHALERVGDLVVLALGARKLLYHRDQRLFVTDFKSRLLAEHAVEQLLRHRKLQSRTARAEVNPAHIRRLHQLAPRQLLRHCTHAADFLEPLRCARHILVHLLFEPMRVRQAHKPARHTNPHILDREFKQRRLNDARDIVAVELKAVRRDCRHAVFSLDFRLDRLCLGRGGISRVHDHDKGLVYARQLLNHTPLRVNIGAAIQVGDAAVAGHYEPDIGMVENDLFRAELRRALEGHRLVGPGGVDHTRAVLLGITARAVDHVAHAVNQPHPHMRIVAQIYLDSLVRDELRLGGHNRPARRRLRKLISGAHRLMLISDIGDYEVIHKSFDERRLARADGTDYADINITVCPLGDVAVNVIHSVPP